MMASSAKEKFDAAVKVIRGLPANGPFQPSHELMLKFYSYYKQATEGRCSLPKPSFWDVVNKKKWESWSKLGNMEREKAMLLYVDELKKIVETMPQTEEVGMFLQKLDTFYEMVEEKQLDNNNVNDTKQKQQHLPNGDVSNKLVGNDHGQGKEDLNFSDNVTQLLKQDMKMAQESAGIVVSENKRNGHGSHGVGNSKGVYVNGNAGNSDESEEEDEVEGDDEDEFIEVVTNPKLLASPRNSVPMKKVNENGKNLLPEGGEGSRKWNGTEWSESETENEEFCDTSDDLVNQVPQPSTPSPPNHIESRPYLHSTSPSTTQSYIPPNDASTPIQSVIVPSKAARNNTTPTSVNGNGHHHHNRFLSTSTEGNASGIDAERENETLFISKDAALANFSLFENTGRRDSSSQQEESNSCDRLTEAEMNCRGGEEETDGRDRRRKGGSHSSRGGSVRDGARRGPGGEGSGTGGSDGGARPPYPNRGGGGKKDPPPGTGDNRNDLNEQIVVTLLRLQRDMSGVLNRLHSLEALVKEGRKEKERKQQLANKSWWPFPDLSFKSVSIIILWPIVLQVVLSYLSRRRRRLGK